MRKSKDWSYRIDVKLGDINKYKNIIGIIIFLLVRLFFFILYIKHRQFGSNWNVEYFLPSYLSHLTHNIRWILLHRFPVERVLCRRIRLHRCWSISDFQHGRWNWLKCRNAKWSGHSFGHCDGIRLLVGGRSGWWQMCWVEWRSIGLTGL